MAIDGKNKNTKKTTLEDCPQDVPLFLRKTYHMIDSCEPAISCWSDDGETFVVKNPSRFEKEIIPQFFKHNKFSSFVRQLNFYSFRKIKYADTIRLDAKLEAETANFWRFRHENFRKGKPHLLIEIKRMNGHTKAVATGTSSSSTTTPKAAASSSSSGSSNPGENSESMKTELDTLKKRIEEMNKNMSALTSMVKEVSLKPAEQPPTPTPTTTDNSFDSVVPVGAKRKNIDDDAMPDGVGSTFVSTPVAVGSPSASDAVSAFLTANYTSVTPAPIKLETTLEALEAFIPEAAGSAIEEELARPDEMLSTTIMDLDEPVHLPALYDPTTTSANAASRSIAEDIGSSADDALIDLCHVGNGARSGDDDMDMEDVTASHLLPDASSPAETIVNNATADADNIDTSTASAQKGQDIHRASPSSSSSTRRHPSFDRADPALMDRLSEALSVLPKEMQEQIVERLIAAITTTDLFTAPLSDSTTTGGSNSNLVLSSKSAEGDDASTTEDDGDDDASSASFVGMPLAAATLAALLSHYSAEVKKHSSAKANKTDNGSVKSIPVIPVHA